VLDSCRSDSTHQTGGARLPPGCTATRDKVRALHRFVIEKNALRGAGVRHPRVKPYRSVRCCWRRFGDCKRQGPAARGVAARTGHRVRAGLAAIAPGWPGGTSQPASLAIFDHAITYVPRLDPVSRQHRGVLPACPSCPARTRGSWVLRVGWGKTTLRGPRCWPASANRAVRVWKVALAADGSARSTRR